MNLREFADPPKQYRPIPYWSLNNEIDTPEVETQIRDFGDKGFGGFVIHAGEGLKTRYLDDTWMNALRRAFDVASELKIEAWLHDEDRGPSGHAGGTLTENHDSFLPKALTWTEKIEDSTPNTHEQVIAYTKKNGNDTFSLFEEKPDDLTGAGIFCIRRYDRGHSRYNGENYVDLLNPEVVKAFIENIYNKYAMMFKVSIGKYLPGIITDGATLNRTIHRYVDDDHSPVSFPWSEGLPTHFEKLHGYSLTANLHHLISSSPEGFSARHDYWLAVNDLFIETFTFPLSSWCSDNELSFSGTIGMSGDFRSMILSGGAVMPHLEHLGIPMIDSPGKNILNTAAIKETVSAACQFGKSRVAAKIFASAGYDQSFSEMKAVIDHHIALGINALSPQQTLYSSLGDRKYDNPPTFSYHHAAWDQMKILNDYTARCAWTASRGKDTASVLVMMPTSGAYGSFSIRDEDGGDELRMIEASYRAMVDELIAEHISFHIGDERIVGRYASIEGSELRIGYGDYKTVILPPAPSWRKSIVDLLESFSGQLIFMGDVPALVDGKASDQLTKLSTKNNAVVLSNDPSQSTAEIIGKFGRLISVTGPDGDEARNVLVNHRIDAGAHIVFLANIADDSPLEVAVEINSVGGVVELDAATGRGYRYTAAFKDGQTRIETTLPAHGSRIFLIDQTQTSIDVTVPAMNEESLRIEGPYTYSTSDDNCLVIDRCTLNIGKKTILTNEPVWKVKEAVWEKTGLKEYTGIQPWVLNNQNVRSRSNRTELTYTFTVQDIPGLISLAMEHADRFTVSINGNEINFSPGDWFIDRQYRILKLEEHIVQGENVITAVTDFLWDTEISPIYLIGDFGVGAESDGFPIMQKPAQLALGSWTEQGFPFYTGTVSYTINFPFTKEDRTRYEVDLSGMQGVLCTVRVNDIDIGAIPFPPYRGDITGALTDGDNTVTICVIGTLRNVFGPLHQSRNDELPLTTIEKFQDEDSPADTYRFVPCGLMEPPRLIKIRQGPDA